jgi:5'-3' exonuclease
MNTWADEIRVAIKGKTNFRDTLDPEYKAQRPSLEEGMRKRLNYIAHYAIQLGAVQCDGWEADDQVVAWAYEVDKEGHGYTIAAIDKDILQYPGNHYNYGGTAKKQIPEDERWVFTSPDEGYMRFCCQLLTGDTVDNIKGITKVGPVKAKKALDGLTHNNMMKQVCEMYKGEFGTDWERKLHVNCNLIYMRRWPEDEFLYKEHLTDAWLK